MTRNIFRNALLLTAATAAFTLLAATGARAQADVKVNGFYASNKAQQGRTVEAAVVLDIPAGYHVNANKVANKFSIPTSVKLEAPNGVRTGALSFPRGKVQRLAFSKEPLSLYEGRAVVRFNVAFPASFPTGVAEVRAKVRYQACNNEICYPPVTREITMPIAVVSPGEQVRRINTQVFGGRGR
jgi:DsbC/DsbD-like thiol-disulfide interchange protein